MTAVAVAVEDDVDLSAAHQRAAAAERRVFGEVFAPRVRMSLREWSERRRMLSPEANALAAEAGGPVPYSTDLTPYHREIMAAIDDPATEFIDGMLPSQDGKTELINNFIGKRIDLEPGPMLVLQPTGDLGQAWSKDRLAPMIRDTPSLRGKVREARSRDSENTILHKKFPGGHLTIVGSNSPSGLSARPIRDVLVDEADRCARSAGSEGDPIRLALRRATTFRRGKKIKISSPTVKGFSRIHADYQLGTQEEFHVPCPHCDEYQFLRWGGEGEATGMKWDAASPETPYYVCVNGCVIEEHHKAAMIERGKWIAKNPSAGPRRRSFWKNALTSNLVAWGKLVAEWIEIQKGGKVEELQTFINTVLCELWDPLNGKETKPEGLKARRGLGYPEGNDAPGGPVPDQVAVLTRSVDTQDDRLEVAVWGWGEGEESWLVDWQLIPGDPATPVPWAALDEFLNKTYATASGHVLTPAYSFLDSGGHHAKEVYKFARTRQHRGVYAIKGSNIEGSPMLGNPTRNNSERAILFMVGSFTGKESLARRLLLETPGPGYVHLPLWADDERIEQFTRCKLVTPVNTGGRKWRKPKREWIETGRVEQYHLYVYALAALQKCGIAVTRNLGRIARTQQQKAQAAAQEPTPQNPDNEEAAAPDRPRTLQRRGGGSNRFGNRW